MGVNNKVCFGIFLINLGVNAFLRGGLDIAAPLKSVDCNLNDIVGSQADIRLAARSDTKVLSSTRQLTLPHVLAISPFSTNLSPASITSFFAVKTSIFINP